MQVTFAFPWEASSHAVALGLHSEIFGETQKFVERGQDQRQKCTEGVAVSVESFGFMVVEIQLVEKIFMTFLKWLKIIK